MSEAVLALITDSTTTRTAGARVAASPDRGVSGARPEAATHADLTVSVVICAYTEERWALIKRAVASAQTQVRPPVEIIVSVDHNEALVERCRREWAHEASSPTLPITVIANKYQGRLGSARNSAAEIARGDIIAFLDDDAWADPDWLDRLVAPYVDPSVVAVGGAPLPEFEQARPAWFPIEFDWVFGCAYAGLPETKAPVLRLIGANMSVRRQALEAIGGFHSDNHDDMDMCHRLKHHRPEDQIVFEPAARVHHFVPSGRTTWAYFWRRCFFVNRGKVEAFRQMEGAANRSADASFVARALSRGLSRDLKDAVRGDTWAVARAASIVAGVVLAGSGHVAGTWQWHRSRSQRTISRRAPSRFPGPGAPGTAGSHEDTVVDTPSHAGQDPELSPGRQEW